MAKVSEKIVQLGWFCGYSLKTITGRPLNFKNPRFIFPRSQVSYRCFCSISKSTDVILSSTSRVVVREKINLTDKERRIFDLLLQVVYHCNLGTQLRVAGGWVRDKLLGKECCYDIDIALDNMMGPEFCEKVNDYLVSTGEKTKGIGVIHSKPEKSKYLETARMRLFDVSIDFVNLTSKEYTQKSKISPMEFGSAEKDAYRRDLTINSLFYNIQTCSVEDFTGRGLDDLKNGMIVTPLPPKEMFLEDPLRVLRAIRFSARCDFKMVNELKVAVADNDVKSAFCDKISRERIGREIELMVSGNQPVKAIECICEFGLFWSVFRLPPNFEHLVSEEQDKTCVGYMDAAWILMNTKGAFTFSDEQRRLYLYAALFLSLRKTMYGCNKEQKISVVKHIFKKSLKLRHSDADDVVRLHNAVERFSYMIPFIISSEYMKPVEDDWKVDMINVPVSLKLRVLLGLLLNDIKDFWRPALMLSIMLIKDPPVEGKLGVFEKVQEEMLKLNLGKVWEVKPLVNERDIMKLLELKNGGPAVSEWRRKVIQWQLAYPYGNAEECINWMMKQKQKQLKQLPAK